jgi:hypothetical protein
LKENRLTCISVGTTETRAILRKPPAVKGRMWCNSRLRSLQQQHFLFSPKLKIIMVQTIDEKGYRWEKVLSSSFWTIVSFGPFEARV